MVDTEVETILREIRERVRAEQQLAASVSPNAKEAGANGALASGDSTPNAKALARLEGYLATTGRAWDRLPPVVSNRSGVLARLELWIKRRLKVATRWYAWEQVNFNAAVHHALRDVLEALSAFEQQLQRIQSNTQRVEKELEAQRTQLKSQLALIESQHVVIEMHRAQIESQRAETESQARIRQAQHLELNARLAELVQELSNRDERLLDEQRVCLKQLSLEISETSTLFDRARRQMEARLDNLEGGK